MCSMCGKEHNKFRKGVCYRCYRNHIWKRPIIKCKLCKLEKVPHAQGLCDNCYQKTVTYDSIKNFNIKVTHNISTDLYRQITKSCIVCSFKEAVDLHHIDKNRKNNSEANLVGLCPNHHRMIHMGQYTKEIMQKIQEVKGSHNMH